MPRPRVSAQLTATGWAFIVCINRRLEDGLEVGLLEMPAPGLVGIDRKPDGLAERIYKAGHLVEETFTLGPRYIPRRDPARSCSQS